MFKMGNNQTLEKCVFWLWSKFYYILNFRILKFRWFIRKFFIYKITQIINFIQITLNFFICWILKFIFSFSINPSTFFYRAILHWKNFILKIIHFILLEIEGIFCNYFSFWKFGKESWNFWVVLINLAWI